MPDVGAVLDGLRAQVADLIDEWAVSGPGLGNSAVEALVQVITLIDRSREHMYDFDDETDA